MLRDVVRRRRWAHAPVMHAASHFYHEKRVAWVSISMHACDPVPIVMGLRLAALRAAGAPPLKKLQCADCNIKNIAACRLQLFKNIAACFRKFNLWIAQKLIAYNIVNSTV